MIYIYTALCVLLGLGIPYVFSVLPESWLCDYNEKPTEKHKSENRRLSLNATLLCGAICGIIMFTFGALLKGQSWSVYLSFALAMPALILIALCDIKYTIIPNEVLIFAFAAGTPLAFRSGYIQPILGLIIGGGVLLLILLVAQLILKKEAMGLGDVLLSGVAGYLCGAVGYIGVIFTAIFTAAIWFSLLLIMKKIDKDTPQPFGPFLVGGIVSAICFAVQWEILIQSFLYL